MVEEQQSYFSNKMKNHTETQSGTLSKQRSFLAGVTHSILNGKDRKKKRTSISQFISSRKKQQQKQQQKGKKQTITGSDETSQARGLFEKSNPLEKKTFSRGSNKNLTSSTSTTTSTPQQQLEQMQSSFINKI